MSSPADFDLQEYVNRIGQEYERLARLLGTGGPCPLCGVPLLRLAEISWHCMMCCDAGHHTTCIFVGPEV